MIHERSSTWTAYNAAQTEEKARFVVLLADLCDTIPQPPQAGRGRPRLPLSDMVFAAAFKVYCGFSSRRFTSDLRSAHERGLISKIPHFNSVSNYLSDPRLTSVLKELVASSSLPLKSVETVFAVDATGFSTSTYHRWFDQKYGRQVQKRDWLKVHVMCGVRTKVVTAVDVSGRTLHDSYFLTPFLKATSENFAVSEVSADRAYLSRENVEAVEAAGATPFIPFKSTTRKDPKPGDAWARMYHYFAYNRDEFLDRYHKRSNVESAFSMIKGKFGAAVRSKSDTGRSTRCLALQGALPQRLRLGASGARARD